MSERLAELHERRLAADNGDGPALTVAEMQELNNLERAAVELLELAGPMEESTVQHLVAAALAMPGADGYEDEVEALFGLAVAVTALYVRAHTGNPGAKQLAVEAEVTCHAILENLEAGYADGSW